jgi:hypothetical protein
MSMRLFFMAIASACVLAIPVCGHATARADEQPRVLTVLQAKPATLLDVFMVAAIDEIQDSTQLRFAAYKAGENALILAQYSSAALPKIVDTVWRLDCPQTFGNFVYYPETNRFVAHFVLHVPDAHPICGRDLSPEADKARVLLMQEELEAASRSVAIGLEAAALRLPSLREDGTLVEKVREEVKARTSVILHWELGSAGNKGYSGGRAAELLKGKGVVIRAYTAKRRLDDEGVVATYSSKVVYKDCDSAEAAKEVFQERVLMDGRE